MKDIGADGETPDPCNRFVILEGKTMNGASPSIGTCDEHPAFQYAVGAICATTPRLP